MCNLLDKKINKKLVVFFPSTVFIKKTPRYLKEYAKANGVKDDRWQFLTSDIESIKDLKKNGFMLYAGELPRGHAIKFVLIDQDGQIRKYYDGTDKASMAVLRKDLNNIVNEIQS